MTTQQRVNKIKRAILEHEPTSFEALCSIVNPITPKNWGWAPLYDINDNWRINELSFYDGKNHNERLKINTNIYLSK